MNELKNELQKLYSDASKHSVYQNVPDFVSAELGYTETIDEGWRSDRPRLSYLLSNALPAPGETWLDFGANTGFFTLSLAHQFPQSVFVAVEANPNHADFIKRVAQHFQLSNVEVISQAIGFRELHSLPRADFLLHLNVLHHAGHDFDRELVPDLEHFPEYAKCYLGKLRKQTGRMLFQIGSNWGGDKSLPLVAMRNDTEKLHMFDTWLREAGWKPQATAYPRKHIDGGVIYEDLHAPSSPCTTEHGTAPKGHHDWKMLDEFPGEFYRRPLFLCMNA